MDLELPFLYHLYLVENMYFSEEIQYGFVLVVYQ